MKLNSEISELGVKSKLYMRVRPRTFYMDIVDMPDPLLFGVTINYYNLDDMGLYMTIEGSGVGYTFPDPIKLGALGSGLNAFRNLDEWFSRAKPAAEATEAVTLTLKGYTDSGYSNLKHTFSRNVTVVFIKSDDVSYTLDVLNNFDDGTVQGWAAANETGNAEYYPSVAAATDYVLSTPYSLKMTGRKLGVGQLRSRLYKSFDTPDKNVIYAILNLRNAGETPEYHFVKNIRIQKNGMVLVYLGRPYDTYTADYFPEAKWFRVVVPLPKNITAEMRVVHEAYLSMAPKNSYLWLDDFKIISK